MDKLSRLLRDSNPFVGISLSERAAQDEADILAGRKPRGRTEGVSSASNLESTVVLVASLGVVVVLISVLVATIRPHSAQAVTPSPLQLTSTSSTIEALREDLMSVQRPQALSSRRGAEWEGWFLQLDVDEPAATFIQPQLVRVTWDADFSGSSTAIAAEALSPDGAVLSPLPPTAVMPGEVLFEENWGPGEYTVPLPESPPDDTNGMRAYLDAFLSAQGFTGTSARSAGEYLYGITALMQLWTLSGSAGAAAVAVLLEAPGVEVTGTTIDRAGRDGVVLEVAATELDVGYRSLVIIDPQEWRILAIERMSTDGLSAFGVPAGSVTDYTLWR